MPVTLRPRTNGRYIPYAKIPYAKSTSPSSVGGKPVEKDLDIDRLDDPAKEMEMCSGSPSQKEASVRLFQLMKSNRTTPEEVETLIKTHGLDINIQNGWKETLLYNCCKHAVNIPVLDWLFDNGCNINLVNSKGYNALNACLKWNHNPNHDKVLDWLRDKKVVIEKEYKDLPVLHNMVICYDGAFDWVCHNYDMNEQDKNGNTPLHMTCHQDTQHNVTHPCTQLCETKLVNINNVNKDGQTPLHLAAKSGFSNCARILLKHGADKNIKDNQNRTPLDVLEQNKTAIVRDLNKWPGDYKDCKRVLKEY
jgi:hypothetical protein